MTSGPYQSNLLRFAIAQYRQAIARHQIAVRTVRSGVVTDAAVSLIPVYAVVNASLLAGKWFNHHFQRSFHQQKLPGVRAKLAKLLDFSNFKETSLTVPDVVALETQNSSAEQIMAQTLAMVGACLSTEQINLLSSAQRPAGLLKRIRGLFDFQKSREIDVSDRITGVASDLETRSLVLVKDHILTWHGLSAEQQIKLQQKIAVLLSGEYEVKAPPALSSQGDLASSEESRSLAWSVRSFWVEVLRVMAWLQRGHRSDIAFQLASGSAQLSGSGKAGLEITRSERASLKMAGSKIAISSSGIGFSEAGASALDRLTSVEISPSDDIVDGERCLEAAVIAVDYIEHPLEKVLKWVDRLLLRLEDLWQMLKQWLLSLRHISRGNWR